MNSKLPALQFYPGDWRRDPGVQALTFEERGIWIEILFLMHESEERGKLVLNGRAVPIDRLARMLHIEPDKLGAVVETLVDLGVASICPDTGALMNRRMVRDEAIRLSRSRAGVTSSTKRQQNVNKPSTNVQQTGQQNVNKPSTNGKHRSSTDSATGHDAAAGTLDASRDATTIRADDDREAGDMYDDTDGEAAIAAAVSDVCENRETPSNYRGLSDSAPTVPSTNVQQSGQQNVNKPSTNVQQTSQQNVNKTSTNGSTKSRSSSSSSFSTSILFSPSYTEGEARTTAREPPKRGTRLPEPFTVTDEMRAWAHERCPDADLDLETEKFVNYWAAKAGRDAVKLDWRRTWQNWILRADEFRRNNRSDTNGNYRSTSRDRLAAHAAILERYPDERQPAETRGDADGTA